MLCERCGREVHKYNVCSYCNKKICNDCLKSSKKVSKIEKAFICKDDWSDMKKRGKYKSAVSDAVAMRKVETSYEDRRGPPRRPGGGRR